MTLTPLSSSTFNPFFRKGDLKLVNKRLDHEFVVSFVEVNQKFTVTPRKVYQIWFEKLSRRHIQVEAIHLHGSALPLSQKTFKGLALKSHVEASWKSTILDSKVDFDDRIVLSSSRRCSIQEIVDLFSKSISYLCRMGISTPCQKTTIVGEHLVLVSLGTETNKWDLSIYINSEQFNCIDIAPYIDIGRKVDSIALSDLNFKVLGNGTIDEWVQAKGKGLFVVNTYDGMNFGWLLRLLCKITEGQTPFKDEYGRDFLKCFLQEVNLLDKIYNTFLNHLPLEREWAKAFFWNTAHLFYSNQEIIPFDVDAFLNELNTRLSLKIGESIVSGPILESYELYQLAALLLNPNGACRFVFQEGPGDKRATFLLSSSSDPLDILEKGIEVIACTGQIPQTLLPSTDSEVKSKKSIERERIEKLFLKIPSSPWGFWIRCALLDLYPHGMQEKSRRLLLELLKDFAHVIGSKGAEKRLLCCSLYFGEKVADKITKIIPSDLGSNPSIAWIQALCKSGQRELVNLAYSLQSGSEPLLKDIIFHMGLIHADTATAWLLSELKEKRLQNPEIASELLLKVIQHYPCSLALEWMKLVFNDIPESKKFLSPISLRDIAKETPSRQKELVTLAYTLWQHQRGSEKELAEILLEMGLIHEETATEWLLNELKESRFQNPDAALELLLKAMQYFSGHLALEWLDHVVQSIPEVKKCIPPLNLRNFTKNYPQGCRFIVKQFHSELFNGLNPRLQGDYLNFLFSHIPFADFIELLEKNPRSEIAFQALLKMMPSSSEIDIEKWLAIYKTNALLKQYDSIVQMQYDGFIAKQDCRALFIKSSSGQTLANQEAVDLVVKSVEEDVKNWETLKSTLPKSVVLAVKEKAPVLLGTKKDAIKAIFSDEPVRMEEILVNLGHTDEFGEKVAKRMIEEGRFAEAQEIVRKKISSKRLDIDLAIARAKKEKSQSYRVKQLAAIELSECTSVQLLEVQTLVKEAVLNVDAIESLIGEIDWILNLNEISIVSTFLLRGNSELSSGKMWKVFLKVVKNSLYHSTAFEELGPLLKSTLLEIDKKIECVKRVDHKFHEGIWELLTGSGKVKPLPEETSLIEHVESLLLNGSFKALCQDREMITVLQYYVDCIKSLLLISAIVEKHNGWQQTRDAHIVLATGIYSRISTLLPCEIHEKLQQQFSVARRAFVGEFLVNFNSKSEELLSIIRDGNYNSILVRRLIRSAFVLLLFMTYMMITYKSKKEK